MKFDKHFPSEQLASYVRYFVISENEMDASYKVFPCAGLVMGFQYQGQLAALKHETAIPLSSAGITGVSDVYKVFRNTAATGTILVYFTETGFAHFTTCPAHELFNQSLSLADVFDHRSVNNLQEQLAAVTNDKQRLFLVEQFLLARLLHRQSDKLISEAIRQMHLTSGTVRILELTKTLGISQSPFEKRFRRVVGTTPKKFASIIRFNAVLQHIAPTRSLTGICYDHRFFDQAHFIRDFRQYTGSSPENFKRSL